ncbi:AfsR family transcriptional regulator [Deinococcus sp. Arct2-2]|uniref:ATP-binding protein n=1 Tax=Deinococcus sp. Arct2-2 TaxID=2568653 RepID=UPI0010A2F97D|nr:BTAD domain-containing putative transcriptional regulator [Deinococcus sp. Arct2-2]THF70895.1 AfsR family transcriptional regulator [Deinococcus sp. Arct2-2]
MSLSAWHFRMLGEAVLQLLGAAPVPLERKAASLLAYLALEGPTRRAQLTALLWPETREAAARNNLVHLLRKLRISTGAELVQGAETLSLAAGLGVDALEARDAFVRGEHAAFLRLGGELLRGLLYDDLPDLSDWVQAERERWREWQGVALRQEVLRCEEQGEYDLALTLALALLDLDPLSEDAYCRLMRLHYLRGDRSAALRAYQKCQDILGHELGLEPLPETKKLARQIEGGRLPSPRPTHPPTTLPLTVLCPPVLIGREREWAQLETAWQAGQVAYVSGAPGVGKTRLARDFAASKGEFLLNEGRPGDFRQPKSSSARAFQNESLLLRSADVPDWVKREMSRYLPEFVEEGFEAPAIQNDTDLLRFRQAMREFYRLSTRFVETHIIDDWQYFDLPSLEDGLYIFTGGGPPGEAHAGAPLICTFREGELSPESEAVMREMIEGGHAVLVEVEPLGAGHVEQLLDSLSVDISETVRRGASHYSGGNPLFLLETIKHLLETRQLTGGFPERLPPPQKVRTLITRRLERLSPPALQAARSAAVLQSDFDLEQIAGVLGAPLLDLVTAWEELEAAQIMQGTRFSHDLVYEAVEGAIPSTVRQLLHRSAARTLERFGVPASRMAYHWVAGGKPELAAAWLLRAAQEALDSFQLSEAAALYGQAAETFDQVQEPGRARDARKQQGELLSRIEMLALSGDAEAIQPTQP